MLNVGIDIGGTKIAGGVVAPDGRILEWLRVPTPTDTDALARAVADMVAELAARHEVNAVGVAAAGYIDRSRSVMLHAPNIDWHDAPLRAQFEALIGRPVTLENDANAAGWGEYRFGAGRGSTDMVMVTLGTGVGGAVITDGHLLIGANGSAAELGDALLEPTRLAYDTSLPGFGERPTARFVTASLGNDAGLVGVADLAGLRSTAEVAAASAAGGLGRR